MKDILSVVDIQTQQKNRVFMNRISPDNLYELTDKINIFRKDNQFIQTVFNAETLINKDLINSF